MVSALQDVIVVGFRRRVNSQLGLIEDIIRHEGNQMRIVGFLDDDPEVHGREWHGAKVLGPMEMAWDYPDARFINTIWARTAVSSLPEIVRRTSVSPERWVTMVHPTAIVSPDAKLGHGVFVYPWVLVYCEAEVGDLVNLKPRATIGGGTRIGWGTFFSTSTVVARDVHVGKSCYMGQCSSVREFINIGDGATVGMGSVVVKDVPPGATVVGNPARIIR